MSLASFLPSPLSSVAVNRSVCDPAISKLVLSEVEEMTPVSSLTLNMKASVPDRAYLSPQPWPASAHTLASG
jgi:hypothetical protein